MNQEVGSHQTLNLRVLDLGLPASRTGRNKYLLILSLLDYGILLQQPKLTKTLLYPHLSNNSFFQNQSCLLCLHPKNSDTSVV